MARVKTNLIRSADLFFLCVASVAAVAGGGMGQAVIGTGKTMAAAFENCKRKVVKDKADSKTDTYLVYASQSDDMQVDASGHVKATEPVIRLTKLNRLGRVHGK